MKPDTPKLHQDKPGPPGTLYRPAEVAKILRCSEWWVKEQARNGRIPYSWIGGSYRFTDVHIAEIVRLFERRPAVDMSLGRTSTPRHSRSEGTDPAVQLKARPPRRARRVAEQAPLAA
ncbi:helix-turn-helix domain-containing protein [Micromonospora sp. NPDC049645]|uniref:helix-turn-helix domain-containing protein n=1 Tax=Micromonospora sp. NPDC049645 TaxID=3155508 RepID=UPI00342791FE